MLYRWRGYSSHVLDLAGSIASGKVELSKGDRQETVDAFGFFEKFVSDVSYTISTIEDG